MNMAAPACGEISEICTNITQSAIVKNGWTTVLAAAVFVF